MKKLFAMLVIGCLGAVGCGGETAPNSTIKGGSRPNAPKAVDTGAKPATDADTGKTDKKDDNKKSADTKKEEKH